MTAAQTAIITAVGSPLQASSYTAPTTPPTVVQIRQEIDSNSTRLASASTAAGVIAATNSVLFAVGSPLQTSSYTVPPTVAAIQSGLATSANLTAAQAAIISAVGSPLQAGSYVAPPTSAAIAAATAGVLFVDGSANRLKVNADHSVASSGLGGAIANYITIPAAVAAASGDPAVITCLRGDTLRVALPPMGDVSGRTKLVMTAKACTSDSDDLAVFQVNENIGLTRLNGSGLVTPAAANLTVTNQSTGTVTVEIDASVTAVLAVRDLQWDVQAILPTGITTPINGIVSIVADVTRSVI